MNEFQKNLNKEMKLESKRNQLGFGRNIKAKKPILSFNGATSGDIRSKGAGRRLQSSLDALFGRE